MQEQSTVTASRKSPKTKYILVVEDDRFYSNIYNVKLTKAGYEVAIAVNGDQTLSLIKQRKPDLILLDLIMATKDGFETLKEIRSDEQLKDIKIVIISNLGQEEDIKQVRSFGVLDYLVKTNISIQNVVDKVKEYLK